MQTFSTFKGKAENLQRYTKENSENTKRHSFGWVKLYNKPARFLQHQRGP